MASDAEREAFVDRVCGEDAALRSRVDALLQAHDVHQGMLDDPIVMAPTVGLPSAAEIPGNVIGPYKLLQQIGEGGMGTVFMAEQTKPVRRFVALKIIKPGMDSQRVIARFEAERQALALMDHPHIAKVLDAGTTDTGRPFFVMELVKGIPITSYCDEHHLTAQQRLQLFVPVCQGVQHAHQKGVIHRDLKPSNVMVTEYDDRPVVKIIDFGVAKATGQTLTENSMFTGFGQVLGTLEYMSPEQAKLNALDVDTRSDIYALGVLLYELLTGTTPLTHDRLKQAAFDEVLRIIREEEPPKPSTRLSDLSEKKGSAEKTIWAKPPQGRSGKRLLTPFSPSPSLASIAALRHIEPARLTKLVTGDLDWIVMKCLEKDRNRRYETANGLAADVQRYLAGDAVLAAPPSTAYRIRKFVRRNRRPVLASIALLATLMAGIVGTTIGLIGQARQRVIAERERTAALDQKAQAESAKEQTKERLFESKVNEARSLTLSQRPGQRFRSLALVDEARRLAEELKLPGERLDEVRNVAISAFALPDLYPIQEWDGLPAGSVHVDFDDNLATYARTDDHGNCSIRRVKDDVQNHFIAGEDTSEGAFLPILSRDGRFVVVHHRGAAALVWNIQGSQPEKIAVVMNVGMVDIHPNDRVVAFAHNDGSISHMELATGKLLHRLEPNGITRELIIALHPSQPLVAVGSYFGKVVQVRDLITGKQVHSAILPGQGGHVAWHPRGHSLTATDGETGDIHVFEWGEGENGVGRKNLLGEAPAGPFGQKVPDPFFALQRRFVFKQTDLGARVVFDHSGNHLAVTGWTNSLKIFDFRTGQLSFEIADAYPIISPRFSHDDQRLAGYMVATRLGIWQVEAQNEVRTLVHRPMSKDEVYEDILPTSDGRLLAGLTSEGIGFWDLSTGDELGFLPLEEPRLVHFEQGAWDSRPRRLTWSQRSSPPSSDTSREDPSRRTSAATARGGDAAVSHGPILIGERSGTYRWPIHRDATAPGSLRIGPPEPVAIPPGGFAQSCDGQVRITGFRAVSDYQPWAGMWIQLAQRPDSLVHLLAGTDMGTAAISPDGNDLVTSDHVGTRLQLWDPRTGAHVRTLLDHASPGSISNLQFSPDGDRLAAGGSPGRLIDTRTWQTMRSLDGSAHFSPDGSVLVLHKDTSTLRLVDVDNGREFCRLEAPHGTIHYVNFAPDGWQLFAVNSFQGIQVWDLVALRKRLAERNLDWDAPPYPPSQVATPPLRIEFDLGDFDELRPQQLEKNLDRAIQAAPQLAVRWAFRAKCHREAGRYAQAEADLREAVKRAELDHNGRYLANLYQELARFLVTIPEEFRNPGEAVDLAEKAMNLRKGEWSYLNTLGLAYYRAGRTAEAVTTLEQSLAKGAGESDALDLYVLAMCHHQLGAPGTSSSGTCAGTRLGQTSCARTAEGVTGRASPLSRRSRGLTFQSADRIVAVTLRRVGRSTFFVSRSARRVISRQKLPRLRGESITFDLRDDPKKEAVETSACFLKHRNRDRNEAWSPTLSLSADDGQVLPRSARATDLPMVSLR